MKTSSKLTLLSCLLLTVSVNFSFTLAQNFTSDPVFDTSGQEVRRENGYYILPAPNSTNHDGGLTLQLSPNGSCPYEIVQSPTQNTNGSPLRFTPINPDDVVRLNVDSNIEFVNFTGPEPCPESTVWRVASTADPVFIITGGAVGNPGIQTLSNWFKIQKYDDAYKIQYCPGPELCGGSGGSGVIHCPLLLCEDIGIYVENGRRRLALNQPPFKVVFERA